MHLTLQSIHTTGLKNHPAVKYFRKNYKTMRSTARLKHFQPADSTSTADDACMAFFTNNQTGYFSCKELKRE